MLFSAVSFLVLKSLSIPHNSYSIYRIDLYINWLFATLRSANLTPAPLVMDTMKSSNCLHTHIHQYTLHISHFTYLISTLSSRNSKNPKLKEHYKLYCKLLLKVIKEAEILQNKKQILTSYNKTRTYLLTYLLHGAESFLRS